MFSGAERAAELLRAAAECSCRGRPLPVHAQEFLDRLRSRRAGSGALAWAIERLQALNERRGSLRWDDRLGVLAFSAAAELLVYMLPSLVLAWLLWSHGGLTEPTRLAILATVCTGFPAALGFLFCGGPVFGLMKIAVQRRDSRPAGRLRCGWRSFVAWAPFTLGYTLLGWMIGIMTAAAAMPADPTDPLAQYAFLTSREFLIASSYWAPLIPFVLGGIYAVVRPTRGIQDLLAGTRLAPR
ncbi:MAG: hypothetical protein HY000_18240 [Planctomycetes bacterium]|nr:hypothetical protein [Planctomycetota bacterium]